MPRKLTCVMKGVGQAGVGIGSLIFTITTRAAIQNLSLRAAYIINGIICFVVLVPVIILYRGVNPHASL
jgi:hypothetical protein